MNAPTAWRHSGIRALSSAVLVSIPLILALVCQVTIGAELPSSTANAGRTQAWVEAWTKCENRTPSPYFAYLDSGRPTYVKIVFAATLWDSDLKIEANGAAAQPLLPSANNNVGKTIPVPETMSAAGDTRYTLDLFVHQTGQTYRSDSLNALAVRGDNLGEVYICFEDGGGDSDYNDLVVLVSRPDLSSLKSLTPRQFGDDIEVDVKYSPLGLVNPGISDFDVLDESIARGLEDRAHMALREYRDLLSSGGNGSAVPTRVEIVIEKDPSLYGALPIENAMTECTLSAPVIKFNADYLMSKSEVSAYVGSPSSTFTPPPGMWVADTVDHELWHAIQCQIVGLNSEFWRVILGRDFSVSEGSAAAAQDAIADTDDLGQSQFGSFLASVYQFLGGNVPADYYSNSDRTNNAYAVAALYEYLAEHYDSKTSLTLEQRLTDFLYQLSAGSEDHLTDVAYAMGKQWPSDVMLALRDFYVAVYAHNAPNSNLLPALYRIFDETTGYGKPPSTGGLKPHQSWGDLKVLGTIGSGQVLSLDARSLADTAGGLWEVTVDPGVSILRLTMTSGALSFVDPLIAAVPLDAFGNLGQIAPSRLFFVGPSNGKQRTIDIPVAGMSKVGLVIVADPGNHPLSPFAVGAFALSIRADELSGPPSLSLDPLSDVASSDLPGAMWVRVHPSFGGVASTSVLSSMFTARIDGSLVTMSSSGFALLGAQWLSIQVPSLSPGTHAVTLCLGSACGTQPLTVNAPVSPATVTTDSKTLELRLDHQSMVRDGDHEIDLILGGTAQAGMPIEAQAIVVRQGEGIAAASVTATVTDPAGFVRQYRLRDDGSSLDGGTGDGEYGVQILGTNLAGTYAVTIEASGTDDVGNPFSLADTGAITLATMVDTDADGVSDLMETELGLDPAEAADGSTDLDGDGLGTAHELAVGTDPRNPDSDGGGEPDGSEEANHRDPLVASDDSTLVMPMLTATQRDGREISVTVLASDRLTPIHLYRISREATADLGILTGSGATIVDGPLAAGDYAYQVVAEMANGTTSLPVSSPHVKAVDDATPPTASMALNGGAAIAQQRELSVDFYGASEPLASMRIADSLDALGSATWTPYQQQIAYTLPVGIGPNSVYAQVRDLAGLESIVLVQTIDLEPGAITFDIPSFASTAIDSNGDGLFEALRLTGNVSVAASGQYTVGASLMKPGNGVLTAATGTFTLVAGSNQITLDFRGPDIRASGVSGPYSITDLKAYQVTSLDQAAWTMIRWTTETYGPLEFSTDLVSQVREYTYRPINATFVGLQIDSSAPYYELWERLKLAGSTEFGDWHKYGMTTSGPPFYVSLTGGDGTYEFYSIAVYPATGDREDPPASADTSVVVDTTPPTASIGSLPAYTSSATLSVPISASDPNGSGVASVAIYARYRSSLAGTWGSWQFGASGTGSESSLSVTLSQGEGYYELGIDASDAANNWLYLPSSGVPIYYTTAGAPGSRALPIGGFTNQTSLSVPYEAQFVSGLGSIDLWERFEPTGGTSFTEWAKVANVDSPGGLVAPLSQGDGRYEFVTQARDAVTGGVEALRTIADTYVNLDTVAPTIDWRAGPSPAHPGPSFGRLTVDFADDASGMARVRAFYHYKATAEQPFGEWKIFADSATSGFNCWPTGTLRYCTIDDYTPPEGDGYYEISAVAIDTAGNANTLEPVQIPFYLDTTMPTVTVTLPAATRSTFASVVFSITDPVGPWGQTDLYIQYTPAGGSPGSWDYLYPVSSSPASAALNQGEGTYSFYFDACDAAYNCLRDVAGDEWVAQASIVLDTTRPDTSVGAMPAFINSASQSIPYTATDSDGSGVATLQLQRRFKAAGSGTFGSWSTIATVPNPDESGTIPVTLGNPGTYEFRTTSTDRAGNSETAPATADASTVLDTGVPSSQAGSLPAYTTASSTTVTYSAADNTNGSGISSVALYERYTPIGQTPSGDYVYVTSSNSAGGAFAVGLDVDGRYEFYTVATDNAGNTETAPAAPDAYSVRDSSLPASAAGPLDPAGKVTALTVPFTVTAGTATSVQLYWRWTAPGATPSGAFAAVGSPSSAQSGTFSVTLSGGDGTYEFYTIATGPAGTEGTPSTADASTVLDRSAPTSQASALTSPRTTASATISFAASDNANGSGLARVELYQRWTAPGATPSGSYALIESNATSPYSVTLSAGDGRYEFYTLAVDAAGNRETAPSSADAYTVLDTTAPDSHANGLPVLVTSSALSVGYSATDLGSGVASVKLYERYTPSGSTPSGAFTLAATSMNASGTFNVTLDLGTGTYEFYTVGVDALNIEEAAPTAPDASTVFDPNAVPPDTSAPVSSITALPATSSAPSTAIAYTASDDAGGSGLASVEFWYRYRASDGAAPGAWTSGGTSTNASGSFTLTFGSGAGIYDVLTVAVDVAGNREAAIASPPPAGTSPKSYVRATSWNAGAKVNTDTGSAVQDNASFVVGPDGTVYAVWEDSRNGNTDIYFSSRNPSTGAWAAETKLNTDTGTRGQRTPAIAIDGSGNLYVVWADDRNGTTNTDIYFAKRTGTTWSANTKVNADTGTAIQSNPRIAVSSSGVAIAVWYDARSSQKNIYSSRLPAGSTTWSTNYKVTSNTSAVKAAPDVAVASDGTAWATWQDNRTGGGDIYVSSLAAGGTTWSTNTKVSDDSGSSSLDKSPRIGLTSGGSPVVAYVDGRTANTQVRVVNRTSGGAWNASVQVSDASAKPSGGLAFAVKADGGVIVAWDDQRVTTKAIWGVQCEAGSGTAAVTRCGVADKWSDQTGAAYDPNIFATTSQIYVGWRDDTAGGGDIRIRLRNPS